MKMDLIFIDRKYQKIWDKLSLAFGNIFTPTRLAPKKRPANFGN